MGADVTKHLGINTKEWQTTEKEVNNELEKQRQRYKPESIEGLVSKTGFSKREIQTLYRSFKENCPNGIVSRQKFLEIYSDFFYFGDATEYAKLVFNTFDEDGNGEISFEEFVYGLSNLWRGSLEEKLTWIFALYDFDRKGFITERNMLKIVQSIYSMVGHTVNPMDRYGHTVDHARDVFQKMDANQDGIITLSEFIECCSHDDAICASLALFQSVLDTLRPPVNQNQSLFMKTKIMFS